MEWKETYHMKRVTKISCISKTGILNLWVLYFLSVVDFKAMRRNCIRTNLIRITLEGLIIRKECQLTSSRALKVKEDLTTVEVSLV